MKLLADENIDVQVGEALRQAGFDVLSIAETAPGKPDHDVYVWVNQENRIL